jgi:L-ascorbate metabolism protein UlaG (beta-lactamase superfamily)
MKNPNLPRRDISRAFTGFAGPLALLLAAGAAMAFNDSSTAAQPSDVDIILPADRAAIDQSDGSIFFIGNATVLIRYGGLAILTDPNFIHRHEQVSIGYGMETTRLRDPAIEVDELPPLDLVVLSHFHGDHFDRMASKHLEKSLPIVTTPEAAAELKIRGFTNTRALTTWSSLTLKKGNVHLRVTSMPGRHGPPLSDFVLPEVMGSVLELASEAGSFRLYITGDTLVIDELKEIAQRFPDIDLALLHLGGTRVLGILVTMDGKQGAQAIRMVDPDRAIPIHYNDYDVMESPLSDFRREVEAAGLEDRVHYLGRGDTYRFRLTPKNTH